MSESLLFASALALVRGLLDLLVSILVSVLDPGLTNGPLLLLLGLIGVSGFMGWSSVRFIVSLDTDMDINRIVSLFVEFQIAKELVALRQQIESLCWKVQHKV